MVIPKITPELDVSFNRIQRIDQLTQRRIRVSSRDSVSISDTAKPNIEIVQSRLT